MRLARKHSSSGDTMVTDSLQQIAPDLSERLRGETDDRLRTVAVAVCRFAVKNSALDSAIVRDVLDRLERGRGVPEGLRTDLEEFVEDLDKHYFEMYRAAQAGLPGSKEVDAAFQKARAAAAVLAACEEDAFVAAAECLYEGWAAIDQDTTAIRRLVAETLGIAESRNPQR